MRFKIIHKVSIILGPSLTFLLIYFIINILFSASTDNFRKSNPAQGLKSNTSIWEQKPGFDSTLKLPEKEKKVAKKVSK